MYKNDAGPKWFVITCTIKLPVINVHGFECVNHLHQYGREYRLHFFLSFVVIFDFAIYKLIQLFKKKLADLSLSLTWPVLESSVEGKAAIPSPAISLVKRAKLFPKWLRMGIPLWIFYTHLWFTVLKGLGSLYSIYQNFFVLYYWKWHGGPLKYSRRASRGLVLKTRELLSLTIQRETMWSFKTILLILHYKCIFIIKIVIIINVSFCTYLIHIVIY